MNLTVYNFEEHTVSTFVISFYVHPVMSLLLVQVQSAPIGTAVDIARFSGCVLSVIV